ncbi:MAG TPA: hypothetical protein VGM44_24090 [Polyangiaceae bacterium]
MTLESSTWVLCGAVALALFSLNCEASANANASAQHARADAEEGPDFDKPIGDKELAAKANANASTPVVDTALLGARHDLSLVGEHANAICACVKVGIGSASSAAFQWQAGAPHLNDDTELTFAMTTENQPCANEPKGSTGASYWGYRIVGNDVIVFLEGAREGRPRTSAAIIPKPLGNGQVYVAPAKRRLPYGRTLDGKGERCKIGGAMAKRTTPFSQTELGDSTARDANNAPTVDDVE